MIGLASQRRRREAKKQAFNVMGGSTPAQQRHRMIAALLGSVVAGLLYRELTVNLAGLFPVPLFENPLQEINNLTAIVLKESDVQSGDHRNTTVVTPTNTDTESSSEPHADSTATMGATIKAPTTPETATNEASVPDDHDSPTGEAVPQVTPTPDESDDDSSRQHADTDLSNSDTPPPPRYWFDVPIPEDSSIFDLSINRTFLPVPENRSDRFPSVEARVQLYMGDWYLPPCRDDDRIPYYYKHNDSWPAVNIPASLHQDSAIIQVVESIIESDQPVLLEERVLDDCARLFRSYQRDGPLPSDSRVRTRHFMHWYCADVKDFFELVHSSSSNDTASVNSTASNEVPVLVFFGDSQAGHPFPLVGKYRGRLTEGIKKRTSQGLEESCLSGPRKSLDVLVSRTQHSSAEDGSNDDGGGMLPILWQVNKKRHYFPINKLKTWQRAKRKHKLWNDKHDKAVWLGAFTGPPYDDATSMDPRELCRRNLRCNFVLQHLNSTLIEAKFTDFNDRFQEGRIPNGLMEVEEVPMDELLHNKILISLEGNDVASGLKWQLYSECLVMMPPPTLTTWAMEELLEPWVHYVPILPNGSNAEEMVRWVITHPSEAELIVKRSQAFMSDLIENDVDDKAVRKEIARRYRQHWRPVEKALWEGGTTLSKA